MTVRRRGFENGNEREMDLERKRRGLFYVWNEKDGRKKVTDEFTMEGTLVKYILT